MEQQRERCLHLLHVLREELTAEERRQMEWTDLVSSSSNPLTLTGDQHRHRHGEQRVPRLADISRS